MKNNLLIGILTVAVVILYILHFTGNKAVQPTTQAADTTQAAVVEKDTLPQPVVEERYDIAYVNMDTLLEKYAFAKDVSARLLKKEKDASSKLNTKSEQLRSDYLKVEERYRSGLLTQLDAQAESERLAKQQQEIQKLNNDLTQNLINEQKKFNKQLQDSILKFFKEYNADKHYKAIFSNTSNDNIIYAEKQLNITNEVIEMLNARYKKK